MATRSLRATCHMLNQIKLGKQVGRIELKVFADKLGYEQKKFMNFNKLWFPWKPVHVQLGTISENTRIGDCYRCAKFRACIKKCKICLEFRVMPPDHFGFCRFYSLQISGQVFAC